MLNKISLKPKPNNSKRYKSKSLIVSQLTHSVRQYISLIYNKIYKII